MKVTRAEKRVIKKHVPILKTISRVGKKRRQTVLANAPPSLYSTIKKICKLLVKGGISLSQRNKKKMTPSMKNILRTLFKTKNIKRHVTQNGGNFASVLRVVLPMLGSLIV